jgi:hypothetical protein
LGFGICLGFDAWGACYDDNMQIVLVVTDSRGKNIVFTTDMLKSHSIDEAVKLVMQGKIGSAHVVRTGPGSYVRADPNGLEKDNIDHLSISSYKLFASLDDSTLINSVPGLKKYWGHYREFLEESAERIESIITIDGIPRTTEDRVIAKLKPYRELMNEAAQRFGIDPNILGAIIIDEIARMLPLEDVFEEVLLYVLNWNSSVGIAQVKLETAILHK